MACSTRFVLRAFFAGALAAVVAPAALAQTTVPYASPAWSDFGTTNITGVTGNFLPGWTHLTGSPDLGDDLFFIPTQSLSGDPGDGALWFLKFDPASSSPTSNESAVLSLSGFTPGGAYTLDFFATIVQSNYASWKSPADALNVSLVGASISSWSSALLTDPIADDDLNDWIPQSIAFTATASTVNFRFNDVPDSVDPALVARLGIDDVRVKPVPAPATSAVIIGASVVAVRRRRDT